MTKTILVIDDDKMLRDALVMGLRKSGFDVISAESAEFAHNILSRIIPDAIVLDRMMPNQDGLSFLKEIRKKGNNTPVIMLTAMSGPENTIDGLQGGADDYMSKPFQLQELVLRLNNITKNSSKNENKMPDGLIMAEDEFFISGDDKTNKLLSLSKEEKKLLQNYLGNKAILDVIFQSMR